MRTFDLKNRVSTFWYQYLTEMVSEKRKVNFI